MIRYSMSRVQECLPFCFHFSRFEIRIRTSEKRGRETMFSSISKTRVRVHVQYLHTETSAIRTEQSISSYSKTRSHDIAVASLRRLKNHAHKLKHSKQG